MRALPALLLTISVTLAGCSQGDKVVGTWTFDLEASAQILEPELARVAPGAGREGLRKEALAILKAALGGLEITLELKDGGEAEFTGKGRGPQRPFKGEWTFDDRKNEIVVTGKGSPQRYVLKGDVLHYLVEVPEGSKSRTLRLVMKRGA
ncbi:MAG: hypothetical protein HRU14_08815 [Planctomycetes bacterium]|nr:hypothetical protein [Planctomycetota bacterium]